MAEKTLISGQHQIPSEVALPTFSLAGKSVLDVGCGTGKDLTHPIYACAAQRAGVDIMEGALDYGREHYPGLTLVCAPATKLPFPAASFDFVVSRVALPYTDIRVALAEISRVMKPGSSLLLTMHDWRHQLKFARAIGSIKGWIRYGLIVLCSIIYIGTGYTPVNPLGGRETFQTRGRLTQQLRAAGFRNITHERTERSWIVRAIR